MKKKMILVLTAIMMMSTSTAFATEKTYTAKQIGQTVTLNGEKVNFAAYNIEGNNYFKLRDLAAAMDGTGKSFNVDYNRDKDSVEITSLTPYTTGNSSISGYTKKGNQKATNSPQSIYLDGKKVTLQAYSVLDYNYCKLRDVADLLDFAVDWNENTNTVNIGTDRGYDESTTTPKPPTPTTPINPNLDADTREALRVLISEIGPGSKEYGAIEGHYEEKDWNQLLNDPYSSYKLSMYFDEYITYHETNRWVLESFKSAVRGWLVNGGDDGVAHMEVFG